MSKGKSQILMSLIVFCFLFGGHWQNGPSKVFAQTSDEERIAKFLPATIEYFEIVANYKKEKDLLEKNLLQAPALLNFEMEKIGEEVFLAVNKIPEKYNIGVDEWKTFIDEFSTKPAEIQQFLNDSPDLQIRFKNALEIITGITSR